jgi:hypothetical protein
MLSDGFVLLLGVGLRGPHQFCGVNQTDGADCPNCNKPLLQLVAFDTHDSNLASLKHSSSLDRIPLLWCWTCDILRGPLVYQLQDRGRQAQLLEFNRGHLQPKTPYPDYPTHFPGVEAALEEIPTAISSQVRSLNRREIRLSSVDKEQWAAPRHQIGGEPFFCGGLPGTRACPRCAVEMELLGSVANRCTDPRGFAGDPFVQLLFWVCLACRILRGEQDLE